MLEVHVKSNDTCCWKQISVSRRTSCARLKTFQGSQIVESYQSALLMPDVVRKNTLFFQHRIRGMPWNVY